jgi:hypothetical protein
MEKPRDYPINECLAAAEQLIRGGVADVYQKWTCQHCGSRQTMEEKNKFFASGICEDCKGTTIIQKCNYMLHVRGPL